MRITFVTDTYAPQLNGVANTLQRLVTGLRSFGDEVDVIRPSVLACEEEGLKVPSVSFPGYPEIQIGLPYRLILQTRWFRARPDIIYVATESPLGVSAINAARALEIPVVSGFHTNFQQYMAHYQMPILEQATMTYLRRIHNRTRATFAPSNDLIAELKDQGFSDVKLLPRGVDTKLFSPKKRDQGLRQEWGANAGSLVGICVGRVAAEKNLPLAIRAFEEIQRVLPDFRGVIVGHGPMLEELRARHPEIIFAGVQRGDDLARHYASADLFVFPSLTETFGNVTLEAMASGLAVVAFDYAGARQHIENGTNGFRVEFGDEDAFVKSAVRLAIDSDLKSIREEARKSARQVRWKKVVNHFRSDLEEILAEHQSSVLVSN